MADFAAQPNVAAYLSSPARFPLTHNETGKQPHAGNAGYKFLSPPKPGSFENAWRR